MTMSAVRDWSVKIHEAFHYKESIERIVREIQREALVEIVETADRLTKHWYAMEGTFQSGWVSCAEAMVKYARDLIPEEPKP